MQEFPEGYDALGAQSSEKEGQAWAHVYAKRWEPVGKAVRAFDTATFEAEALWGNDVKQKATDLRKCVRSLQVGIEAFIRNQYSGGENFQDRKFAEKIESVIWDFKAEENEFTQRIDKAIEEIELVIRPHLSR